jgi:hypothetical protein
MPQLQFPCNCCGFRTLLSPESGSYEVCPVCFWEDDPVQAEDLSFAGGANAISLAEARENYLQCGACEPRFSDQVRHARIGELPYPPMISGLDAANRVEAVKTIKKLLLGIVRAILAGEVSTVDGSFAIANVAFELPEPELTEVVRTFEIVAGECDEFPTGETRFLWAPEALKIVDAQAQDYERRVRNEVQNACLLLKNLLEAEGSRWQDR